MGTLMDCIAAIPKRSEVLMMQMEETSNNITKKLSNNYKKVVIIGSGSSYNAGLFIKSFTEKKLNIGVELFLPNDFMKNTNYQLFEKETLFVFISQSGMTKLVLDSLEVVKELGFDTVGITEDSNSNLANEADLALITLDSGEAYRFRTIGFTTTVILLYQLMLVIAKNQYGIEIDSYVKRLERTVSMFEPMRIESLSWYNAHKSEFDAEAPFIFTGAMSYWPVVKEADIKFMEMIPVLSNSFELEEIIHGPQNMFRSDQVFFILSDEGYDYEKAKNIKLFIEEEVKAVAYLISKNSFNIEIEVNEFVELLYLMFFQVIGFSIANSLGMDLKNGVYPRVTEYVTKSID